MYDIVFLHPPSSFNKLKHPLSGVFSASVGSTDVLGHEPVGIISMAHDLLKRGYKTKIFNVGKMLLDLRYNGVTDTDGIRDFAKNLQAEIFGIGLHWAAHAPGAIELARLIKECHPQGLVLLGGMTATYYHGEIVERFPFIDLVVLGEVDGLIHEIVDGLLSGQPYGSIPNIAYRKNGKAVSTALRSPVKTNLFYVRGFRDELIEPNTGFSRWDRAYLRDCMIPLVHGCQQSCAFCGGGGYFYRRYFCRNRPEVMRVEEVLANIKAAAHQGASHISLFGDVRFLGDRYWRELTSKLSQEHFQFSLYLEVFSPAMAEYMEAWRKVTSGKIIIALSPESADVDVRRVLGKDYSNEDIIRQVALGMDLDVTVSLGFMFPLPKQDLVSIARTQDFIKDLCLRFHRLINYMFEPFLFVDPGSPIFDNPERYGYNLKDRTLEGLIETLSRPHWFFGLNYSTKWMNKKEIIDAIFFVASSRNALYMDFFGPTERSLFHKALIAKQKELVNIFEHQQDLGDEQIEEIIERVVDEQFREMNFSITAPDFDFVQRAPKKYSVSRVFRSTVRMITRFYIEAGGEKELLSVYQESGLFEDEIPIQAYKEELAATCGRGNEVCEISFKPPRKVWTRVHKLVSTLELSLEGGLVEEFVKFDWAQFVVRLYIDTCLKHLYEEQAPPNDIRGSEVWLPLKNAYVKLSYKHDGKVVKRRQRLTIEKGPTYLLMSYTGEAYPVSKQVFSFLKGCGYRMPFPRFYKKTCSFVQEPRPFIEWLQRHGFILFAPPDGVL
jgi:B12-binding domain/radical SAM domain protein